MLYYSINEMYRKKLYSNDDKQILVFFDSFSVPKKDIYLRIMIIDGYQVLDKRKNDIECDKMSKRLYRIIRRSSFSHIKEVLEDNYQLLQVLFINAKGFFKIPYYDRCLLIGEERTREEHLKMLSLDPLYLVDACCYQLQKDLHSINFYYKDCINKTGDRKLRQFYSLIVAMMDKLQDEDKEMYNFNMLEILKGFYIGNKFLSSVNKNSLYNSNYIEVLEKEDIEKVTSELIANEEEFSKIIAMYLSYHTDLEGSKDINHFIEKNISTEMVKKLKIDNIK